MSQVPRRRALRLASACSALAGVLAFGVVVNVGTPGAHASPSPLVGPLAVSGTHLVDLGHGGTPVVLRGVDVEAEGSGPYIGGIVDAAALRTLQGWGANFVDIKLSADEIVRGCANETYDPTYASDLASTVQELTASGIYVLLTIDSTNPNCHWTSPQTSKIAPLPGEDAVGALAQLAAAYGADPLVGFEPFNEPEACARAATGPGASLFVPAYGQQGDVCANETLADIAWSNPGTVQSVAPTVLGIDLSTVLYQTPGMDALDATIMNNVPKGSTPLVFLDANYFASDTASFDSLGSLATAGNLVEVFHPYDCQDTSAAGTDGHQNANCRDTHPETCATTGASVQRYMTDRLSGAPQNRPVVFGEMNFPAAEHLYQAPVGPLGTYLPINLYQHGLWVNNMITAMQTYGAAGWGIFELQNADVDNFVGAYTMVQSSVGPGSPTPWPPNANDAPAVASMGGQTLSCQNPPLGYDGPV